MPKKRITKSTAHKKLRHIVKRKIARSRPNYWREAGIVAGLIALVVVALQMFYPADRTLPFAKVADVEVGSLTKRDAVNYLFQTYSNVPLTATFDGDSIVTTTDKAGVLVDFQKAADAVSRYPWWQRLVPFSIFYKAIAINAKPEVDLDAQLVDQFTHDIKSRCDHAARDASVAIQAGTAILVKGTDGRLCDDKEVQNSLKTAIFHHQKASVVIAVRVLHPKKTNEIAASQFDKAKAIINSGFTIIVAGKKTAVPRDVLASWVVFADDPVKQGYDVTLNDSAVQSFLQSLHGDVYVAPFPSYVHTLDGVETTREPGKVGRDIDYAKTIEQIKQTLLDQKTNFVTASVADIAPPLSYLNNYSQSQHGLERLLSDIVAEKGNYGIVVTELSGMGRSASVSGNRLYVSASTFKLFVVYFVLKDLESGNLKWDDVITDGLNVRQCFEEMIVRSANRCAIAYIARYGGQNIVNKMHDLGFASVKRDTTWWATPNDMALYLQKLERGELLQGDSREFLLSLLKRQIWRYGIPTGIPAMTIADKVGFLDDYIHDLAIVYSPHGTYILAIMTKGGSYSGMADVARRVENYLRQ